MKRSQIEPKLRIKKCKACARAFQQNRIGQQVCGQTCAYTLVTRTRERSERKDIAKRKVAIKTRSDWMKEAQVAFNAYIRERDKDKPCICCGKPLQADAVGGGFDCGHYRSVGSAPHLRFMELNAHGQTKQCNRYGAGRAVDYRLGLIKRIGLQLVEILEGDNLPAKWTIEDLQAIKAKYKLKLKELKA